MRTINLGQAGYGHRAPITSVDITRSGNRVITGSYDGTVMVWESGDDLKLKPIARAQHRRLVNTVRFHPKDENLFASGSADKSATIWHLDTDGLSPMHVMVKHTDDVNSVAWAFDGSQILCVSEDGGGSVWDALTGGYIRSLPSHLAHCMMVDVSSIGDVCTVGEDGLVRISDLQSGNVLSEKVFPASIEGCAWSCDGTKLALARDDGYLEIVDRNITTLAIVKVSSSACRSVAWAADDSNLVVGGYDGHIHSLNANGTLEWSRKQKGLWPRSVAMSDSTIVVGSFGALPAMMNWNGSPILQNEATDTWGVNCVTLDGESLIIGTDSGEVISIGMGPDRSSLDANHVEVLGHADSPILSITSSASGVYAGTYSDGLLDLGGAQQQNEQSDAPVTSSVAFHHDLIFGTYGGEIYNYNSVTRSRTPLFRAGGSVKSLVKVDSVSYVSGATDRHVRLHRGGITTELWTHANLVNSVTALGERLIASGSRDRTVKIGLLNETGELSKTATLIGPDESIKSVCLLGSPMRPVVLAGSYDFTVTAWYIDWDELSSGSVLARGAVVAEYQQAVSCSIRLNNDTALIVSWDGSLEILRVEDGSISSKSKVNISNLIDMDRMGGALHGNRSS